MKKRYWLKGGIIGLSIMILVSMYGFSIDNGGSAFFAGDIWWFLPSIPPILLFSSFGFKFSSGSDPMFILLINIIFWFGIGALIGHIYEKNTHKNKNI